MLVLFCLRLRSHYRRAATIPQSKALVLLIRPAKCQEILTYGFFTCSDFASPFILSDRLTISKRMSAIWTHEIPETLEDPDHPVLRRSWSGFYHRERRQRCQRHLHLFRCRGAVRASAAVDVDSDYVSSDRSSRDLCPHGSRYRQGP